MEPQERLNPVSLETLSDAQCPEHGEGQGALPPPPRLVFQDPDSCSLTILPEDSPGDDQQQDLSSPRTR